MGTRGSFEAVPVEIRGIVYPSQWQAAKALGVNQRTICRALEDGWLDRVGLTKRRAVRITIAGLNIRLCNLPRVGLACHTASFKSVTRGG